MKDERILAENIRVSNDTRITKLNNNDLIIGSSGCGKTGGYVIPNIQNITGSLIVSDTKGQLCRMFKNELEAKGYKVYALDLVNPLASCGWNPIRSIRMYPDDSYYEQDILTFANTIMPVLDRYEPFWEKAAAAYIAFLVSFCLEAVHDSGHNMRNIFNLHNSFITPQGEMPFAEWVCEHPDSFTASRYNRVASVRKVEKTWECIIEFANRALEPFGFKEVGHIFENENSIDILELGREKNCTFHQQQRHRQNL